MRQFIFTLLIILGIGCTPSTITPTESLVFSDMDAFDKSLSNQMSAGSNSIDVTSTTLFKMDKIPERLSKWLDTVVNYQGTLDVQPRPDKQPLALEWVMAALPTVYSVVYDYIGEKMLYNPAKNYNATIFYDPTTQDVKKITFTKKANVPVTGKK